MFFKTLFLTFIAAFAGLMLSGPVPAATFTALPPNEDRCRIKMQGEIVPGDLERLQKSYKDAEEERAKVDLFDDEVMGHLNFSGLCLDSPGGSYLEAIRMIDFLGGDMSTVIPANARCLSACALIFMAGGYTVENDGSVFARTMHVTGKLGFHAPGLNVPEGSYDAEQVQRAYLVSVQAIAALVDRKVQMTFADTLLSEMLATPPTPETFFYIDTVGKAARWDIMVSGVAPVREITSKLALNACMNTAIEALAAEDKGVSVPYWLTPFGSGNSYSIKDDGTYLRGSVNIGNEAGAWRCEFTYRRDHDLFDWVDRDYISSELASVLLNPTLFYDGDTPLAAIADGLKPDADYTSSYTADTNCFVLRGTNLLDKEPCQVENTVELDDDLRLVRTETFLWPSGARTILKSEETGSFGQRQTINGNAYDYDDSFSSGPYVGPKEVHQIIDEGFCILNNGSGNTFCYQSYN